MEWWQSDYDFFVTWTPQPIDGVYIIALNPRMFTSRLFTRRFCGGVAGGNPFMDMFGNGG
jgi:hypothetical protein